MNTTTTFNVRVVLKDGDERVDEIRTYKARSAREALTLAELDVLAGRGVHDVAYCAVTLVP